MPSVDPLRARGLDLLRALIPGQRGPVDDVRADDELLDALGAGEVPSADEPLVQLLAAWRDEVGRYDI